MTVSETLIQTWDAVLNESSHVEGYYHRRLPGGYVWPAHAAIRRPGEARVLILETTSSALRGRKLREETKGYAIDIAHDEAGRPDRASIRIQETSSAYREIFIIFCADILSHWGQQSNAADALEALERRLARWRKFFQRGGHTGLSREDYIGLYGELSFLECGLKAGMSPIRILDAWQGPLGTNQDFLFGAIAAEIKTTTGNDFNNVRITNARQLDCTGLHHLFLTRFAFDFRQGSGRSLRQLIATLIELLPPDAIANLNERLVEAGFLEEIDGEFDSWGFTQRQMDVYKIAEGFPHIQESTLPTGVSEISYTLNLSSATQYQTTESCLWTAISTSHV